MSGFRLFSSLALACAFVVAAGAGAASAKPKKKKAPVATQKKSAEQKRVLGELKGQFSFGMTKDQVIATLTKQIEERYAGKISETSDMSEQDNLRGQRKKEIQVFADSYTEFKGEKSGWDVSVVAQEFAHNTDESMLFVWENTGDKDQRRFFFFFEGKLWKIFVAIGTKGLSAERSTFASFLSTMEARYGRGKVEPARETWKSGDFDAQALDLSFHGAFGLVIQQASTLKAITAVRIANAPAKDKGNSLINMVKDKGGSPPGLDENTEAIDEIIRSGAKPKAPTK